MVRYKTNDTKNVKAIIDMLNKGYHIDDDVISMVNAIRKLKLSAADIMRLSEILEYIMLLDEYDEIMGNVD